MSTDINKSVQIKNVMGLHMRPADLIVKTLEPLDVRLLIKKDALEVDASSILSLLSLSASHGEELELCASGPDSEVAVNALVDLFSRGFDETEEAPLSDSAAENAESRGHTPPGTEA